MKHVIGFSGGVDSQAVARWIRNRENPGDVILLNSNVGGHEHPLTDSFIRDYSDTVHPVTVVTPVVGDLGGTASKSGTAANDRRTMYDDSDTLTIDILAKIKNRFPSMRARFCTEFLKVKPANRWIRENITGDYIRYSGIRRQESKARSNAPINGWDDAMGKPMVHPLADWTKQMCFDYVTYHGEEINQLYTLGFKRVGCAPCVNSTKGDIFNWVQRFPEMIDRVREYERTNGTTFFPPCVPGMKINWIDDVVAWSKTIHGGKQVGLKVLYDPPACDSDYGLCE